MSGGAEEPAPAAGLDEASASWVTGLSCQGPEHDATVARLHELLLRVARGEAHRRAGRHGLAGPELEDLAHQAAADAVLSILRRLPDFRGESRFTTWAYKFVILEVSGKVSRHAWSRTPVPLDAEDWEQLPVRLGNGPDELAEAAELATAVREAVDQVLTPHQRRVFVALVLNAMPLDVLAAELGSTRNAIYKTMFDARRKLRLHLVAAGFLRDEEASR